MARNASGPRHRSEYRQRGSLAKDMAAIRSTLNPVRTTFAIPDAKIKGTQERLLDAQEVSDWLGVSPRWVLAHAAGLNRPVLPSVKLGKSVRFERSDIEEFIRRCARRDRAV